MCLKVVQKNSTNLSRLHASDIGASHRMPRNWDHHHIRRLGLLGNGQQMTNLPTLFEDIPQF
jgi:heme oxygenase